MFLKEIKKLSFIFKEAANGEEFHGRFRRIN
jgi:hypothetical protein